MGLALGIVLECDLIVAAARTKFQVTETSRGLGGAKYWALLNFRGAAAFATEVTLTGRFFTAEEALAAGIINRVAPEGRHLEVAYELAAEVAKNPPLSVRATVRRTPGTGSSPSSGARSMRFGAPLKCSAECPTVTRGPHRTSGLSSGSGSISAT
jgi:enoyl-CoA hydratase/carnithine racemase